MLKSILQKAEKLFGSLNITWPKLIVFAVAAGIYTGVMAMLPIARETSFADISITFEWWVLFGILIIVNSKTPKESALKCFVFFLISQPLVYLVQVPFSWRGWSLFAYYPPWFIWTLLTLPMGFAGYYMRKEKWWSLLILVPVMGLVAYQYVDYFRETTSFFPHHLLTTVFCAATVLIYPLCIFKDKKLKIAGFAVSLLLLIGATVLAISTGRMTYDTTVMISGGSRNVEFDDTYSAYLEDEAYGEVTIVYEEKIESYIINASFVKTGQTKLILISPDGEKRTFDLVINRDSYEVEESKTEG